MNCGSIFKWKRPALHSIKLLIRKYPTSIEVNMFLRRFEQMQHRVQQLVKGSQITGDQLITLNTELVQFMDICGACERIKNTPIPYSYSSFLKKFIVIYVLTLPFGFVFTLGYIAVPVVMFIFYVMASLELIAEEIEEPFGTEANDLPMERLADMIKRNVAELLESGGQGSASR